MDEKAYRHGRNLAGLWGFACRSTARASAVIQRGAQGEARTLIGHVFNDREQPLQRQLSS